MAAEKQSIFPYILVGLALLGVFVGLPVLFFVYFGAGDVHGEGRVAIIPIEGVIMTSSGSSFGESYVGSDDVVAFIGEASRDPIIDAIILEINSPGGSAVASDEIASAVLAVEKPVVAVIREAGASGGYWVASSADYVVANRMSITGSIGVISSYLEFSGLMDQYGVHYEQLTAGEYKDMGSPFRSLTSTERDKMSGKLDRIHEFFIEGVASNRNMSIESVRELATGEFYLGVEAYELGLVDALGGDEVADAYIMEQGNYSSLSYVVYERDPSLIEMLSGVMTHMSMSVGRGIMSGFVEQGQRVRADLR